MRMGAPAATLQEVESPMRTGHAPFDLTQLLFMTGVAIAISGCSTTAPMRAGQDLNGKTVTRVGDRSLPSVVTEPGDAKVSVNGAIDSRVAASPTRRRTDLTARISGRVLDAGGEPASNVRVRVADGSTPGGRAAQATTDRAGGFTLRGLRPDGSYTIIAELDDGRVVQSGRATARAEATNVRIRLSSRGAETDAMAGPGAGSEAKPSRTKGRVSPASNRDPIEDEEAGLEDGAAASDIGERPTKHDGLSRAGAERDPEVAALAKLNEDDLPAPPAADILAVRGRSDRSTEDLKPRRTPDRVATKPSRGPSGWTAASGRDADRDRTDVIDEGASVENATKSGATHALKAAPTGLGRELPEADDEEADPLPPAVDANDSTARRPRRDPMNASERSNASTAVAERRRHAAPRVDPFADAPVARPANPFDDPPAVARRDVRDEAAIFGDPPRTAPARSPFEEEAGSNRVGTARGEVGQYPSMSSRGRDNGPAERLPEPPVGDPARVPSPSLAEVPVDPTAISPGSAAFGGRILEENDPASAPTRANSHRRPPGALVAARPDTQMRSDAHKKADAAPAQSLPARDDASDRLLDGPSNMLIDRVAAEDAARGVAPSGMPVASPPQSNPPAMINPNTPPATDDSDVKPTSGTSTTTPATKRPTWGEVVANERLGTSMLSQSAAPHAPTTQTPNLASASQTTQTPATASVAPRDPAFRTANVVTNATPSNESSVVRTGLETKSSPKPTGLRAFLSSLRGGPPEVSATRVSYCRYNEKERRIVDFRLPDLNGRTVGLGDLDADLILLDFWGTWCPPCRDAAPKLAELQSRYDPRRVRVVGIACEQGPVNERASRVAAEAERLGIAYTQLLSGQDGPCPLQAALHIQSFPTLVLINRRGEILWRDQSSQEATLARLERVITTKLRVSDAARPKHDEPSAASK